MLFQSNGKRSAALGKPQGEESGSFCLYCKGKNIFANSMIKTKSLVLNW